MWECIYLIQLSRIGTENLRIEKREPGPFRTTSTERILIKIIEKNVGMRKETLYCIVHKFGYTKVWAQLVPRLLSEAQKCLGMSLSLQHLTEYSQNGNDFLLSIIAGGET